MKIYEHDESQKWQRPVPAKAEGPSPGKPDPSSEPDFPRHELLAYYLVEEDFHDRISKIQERLSRVLEQRQQSTESQLPNQEPAPPESI